ncbi:translation initiation factor IF-2 [Campylobacter fetus subsp. testudinum]|uniref:translation initiation factor IF-2 n=1 Tax=Campylobacter fetus TaxID=196 RepID=UPI00057D9DE7|nr:translation initiation factor IF-2 [Campylobacter fetus]AJB46020.1 translation initiation factor IF-2 [Campylobacter fetus subsp. testudinum]
MANIRIHEIAKELGYSNKEILEKAKELGFKVTTSSSAVTPEDAAQLYDYVQSGKKPESPEKKDIKQNTQKEAPNTQMQQKPIEQVEQNVEIKQNVDSTPVKLEPKQESLASSTLSKRRGLVIVKKKKEEVPPLQKQQSEPINKGLEAIFSSSDENLKKKKKEKKPIIAIKKESSAKMDLLSVVSFSDDIAIDDEDVVVLPDLTVKPIEVERQNTVKKQINVYKTSQNNNFSFEGGIQRNSRKKHKKVVKDKDNEDISNVDIPKEIRLYEFADKIKKSSSEVIAKLFMLGKMTTKNDFLEEDEIEILGAEFGIEVNIVDTKEDFDYVKAYEDEILEDNGVSRAPVVTIMGHVDHGKTSLLDYIRNSRVASGEAGGITQHVGAYMVEKNGKNITFIDTPGHEAFTAMRARGASVTDIVIVVVAADDGVKPQTKEAINHAKAAGVPIIIAINKMDKESANPDLVKTGLADLDILPTEWGGSYEFVPISAKTGMGIEDLLEIVLLQAEILELKANPSREAKATIIESSLQKGRGPVATAIVENGTLRVGDTIVAGVAYGKVRALQDDKGNSLKSIKPGECGVIIGLSEVPDAGETLISVKTDKEAREYAQKKYDYLRQKELSKSTKVTIDELSARIAEGELKSLPLIVKADVQGSLEAIKASLEKLKNDEIKVDIIHSGVGGITQSDITLASASANCVILGFNIRPTGDVKEKAKERSVEIKTYNVIYNLIDDVKALLSGLMSPIISEEELGQAVIRQVINVPKIGQIAGCMVTDGSINRGAKIRVIRDGVVVFEGNVSSLKRFKDDVKEVAKGYECGVGIEGYNDMREGDYIESYKEVESKVEL